jgi:hypothetical protein
MVREERTWHFEEPEVNEKGVPLVQSIVEKLGCLSRTQDDDYFKADQVTPRPSEHSEDPVTSDHDSSHEEEPIEPHPVEYDQSLDAKSMFPLDSLLVKEPLVQQSPEISFETMKGDDIIDAWLGENLSANGGTTQVWGATYDDAFTGWNSFNALPQSIPTTTTLQDQWSFNTAPSPDILLDHGAIPADDDIPRANSWADYMVF